MYSARAAVAGEVDVPVASSAITETKILGAANVNRFVHNTVQERIGVSAPIAPKNS